MQAADLRKLVKIVRQYEVIYGGGISSSDAALREECESLVALLERELGGAGRGSRAAASLPSLVDAKHQPRAEKAPRPLSIRATELADLASRGPAVTGSPASGRKGGAGAKPAGPPAAANRAGKAAAVAKGGKAGPAQAKAAAAKGGKAGPAKAGAAKAVPAKAGAKGGKAGPSGGRAASGARAEPSSPGRGPDRRSAHPGAEKAALERARRAVGSGASAKPGEEHDTKKRFAALHLFDAYIKDKLPKYGGFIVCIRFSVETGYTVIEIIGYENLQDIYPEGETLVFKSVGCKLFAVIEPASYLLKSVEPVNRPSDQMVPYRFSELLRITTKRFQNILVGRKPVFMPTSFSVFKPAGEDLVVLFYDIADVYSNIQDFLIMILRDRMSVPIPDSRKAAEVIARGIREFRLWLDEA